MKLHATCLQTHNIDKMAAFYERVFGYAPTIDGGVDFRFLEHQLVVFKLEENEPQTTAVALIYNTENVDEEFSRLHAMGMADAAPTDKPWGVRSFMINDPDGNTLSFMKQL